MFGMGADAKSVMEAMSKSQAIIEFSLDGNVIIANENFCRALGYTLSEIVGKHHRIFVDPADSQSAEYKAFWTKLAKDSGATAD